MAEGTKERILETALELFAQNGYLGTSMNDIAGQLGFTKAALYKHYASKQEILDRIVERMNRMDYERAESYEMPETEPDGFAEAYLHTPIPKIRAYSMAQFDHWTKEPFSANFRKMLTLEQYRDQKLAQLHHDYLAGGPLAYMAAIFRKLTDTDEAAMELALGFYGPMYLLYSVYDGAQDKDSVAPLLDAHIKQFIAKVESDYRRRKGMSEKNSIIRPETKDDYRAAENLTREAFWNVYRPGCMEHYVLHCYRDDPAFVPELDFVMELDGELMGQVIYVRSEIDCDDGRKVPIMTFGPISIAPAYKRQGYGKQLLDYSMEKAKEMGAGALAITGNIDFYGKSGFVPAKTKGVRYADDPEADYFLIKELTPGFLDGISGTYKDPEGYFICEKDPEGFERFEATFPAKEKRKLPGQLC